MKLCIVRHGDAGFSSPDFERRLTALGRQQAKGAGQWIKAQFDKAPRLVASPYLRAQETATIIAKECGLQIETWPNITPEGNAKALVDKLTGVSEDIVLVSHLPLVGYLAATLVDGRSYNQPWSAAECRLLQGEILASGCLSVANVWLPAQAC